MFILEWKNGNKSYFKKIPNGWSDDFDVSNFHSLTKYEETKRIAICLDAIEKIGELMVILSPNRKGIDWAFSVEKKIGQIIDFEIRGKITKGGEA